MKEKRMVVVTTKDKGVFFGELIENTGKEKAILKDAQMCVYWNSETRGVLGLASSGPADGCRITPIIPQIELFDITSFMDCTSQAVKKWREEKWD